MISPWWPIGAAAAGTVAVIVSQRHSAKLARDQQLRIERHREDPTYPLEAPPGKIRIFFRSYGALIFGLVLNLCLFVYWLSRPLPVSREVLFNVAYLSGSTAWMFSNAALVHAQRANYEVMKSSAEVHRMLNDRIDTLVEVVKAVAVNRDKL